SLIRKYQLSQMSQTLMTEQLRQLLTSMSIYKLVMQGILKVVKFAYQFNNILLAGSIKISAYDLVESRSLVVQHEYYVAKCEGFP
ncbi:MAG TPA: hypothetical protein PKJ08_03205, partial [Candidatus Cloacimonadota bacterium]|nr:hypothetical protein [Candidatus Cloacimonadota bacterium]